jgi:alpha-mannosidase
VAKKAKKQTHFLRELVEKMKSTQIYVTGSGYNTHGFLESHTSTYNDKTQDGTLRRSIEFPADFTDLKFGVIDREIG